MTLDDLETPFLTIDLDAVERNVQTMQRYCDAHAIALRPHIKTHKLPRIAAMQLAAGAVGLTCQKLGEAELLCSTNTASDILITYPLIGGRKPERFAALAQQRRLAVGADSAHVARALSEALVRAGTSAGFLVDCDTGFNRTGVQTPQEAADLAELVGDLPAIEFRGLMTYPSTVNSGPWLAKAIELIEGRGLKVSCVSGGGSPLAFHSHELGVINELRVGSYVYADRRSIGEGTHAVEDCAIRVRATVVSRPTPGRAIVDAGSKTLSSDLGLESHGRTYGMLTEYPEAVLYALSEEHGFVDVSRCEPPPAMGEAVNIVPNHACAAVNLYSDLALHRSGSSIEIVPVSGRGLSR